MSYGIIFIGRQGLNIEDFARYVEKHYLCDEYLVQVMWQIKSHNSIKDILFGSVMSQGCHLSRVTCHNVCLSVRHLVPTGLSQALRCL